jgi:hypothetical protein
MIEWLDDSSGVELLQPGKPWCILERFDSSVVGDDRPYSFLSVRRTVQRWVASMETPALRIGRFTCWLASRHNISDSLIVADPHRPTERNGSHRKQVGYTVVPLFEGWIITDIAVWELDIETRIHQEWVSLLDRQVKI